MPSENASSSCEVRLACEAMRCRFELLLDGDDPVRLRAAGEEALDEVLGLERQLSFFNPSSDLSRLNREAFRSPIRVESRFFDLLLECLRLWEASGGSFDPTVATHHESGRPPARSGMNWLELDSNTRRVRFLSPGTALNLGAIAKGYALDRAAEILQEARIPAGFLHAGTSSVRTWSDQRSWTVAISAAGLPGPPPARVELRNGALGVSGNDRMTDSGRALGPHVVDPVSGRPASGRLAAVLAESAAAADALSTALLCHPAPAGWIAETLGILWLAAGTAAPEVHYPKNHRGPRFELETTPALE